MGKRSDENISYSNFISEYLKSPLVTHKLKKILKYLKKKVVDIDTLYSLLEIHDIFYSNVLGLNKDVIHNALMQESNYEDDEDIDITEIKGDGKVMVIERPRKQMMPVDIDIAESYIQKLPLEITFHEEGIFLNETLTEYITVSYEHLKLQMEPNVFDVLYDQHGSSIQLCFKYIEKTDTVELRIIPRINNVYRFTFNVLKNGKAIMDDHDKFYFHLQTDCKVNGTYTFIWDFSKNALIGTKSNEMKENKKLVNKGDK